MLRHLGYMAATQSIDAFTGRTCRPTEATPDRLRILIRDNLRDLARILNFNAERGIAFYRVCSRIIPFGSNPGNTGAWWDEFSVDFDRIGQFVRRHGLRLEMHPGQQTLFNSPSPETVALSILELGWHVRFLEAMQLDSTHKLVVRVGGTFGEKSKSIDRFVAVIDGLPDAWKRRIVVENDEQGFGISEVLDASDRLAIPVVLGYRPRVMQPDEISHGFELIARCFDSWQPKDGPPVVHLAGLAKDRVRLGPHAEWVEPSDLEMLLAMAPPEVPFDCLLEAQQGDRALFELRERMAIREHGVLPGWRDATTLPMI